MVALSDLACSELMPPVCGMTDEGEHLLGELTRSSPSELNLHHTEGWAGYVLMLPVFVSMDANTLLFVMEMTAVEVFGCECVSGRKEGACWGRWRRGTPILGWCQSTTPARLDSIA